MPKNYYSIKSELEKWFVRSRSLRTSAGICYGKIKSHISLFEDAASRADISKLQTEAGNLDFFWGKIGKNCYF